MTTYGTSPTKRTRRTKADITRLDTALHAIVATDPPMTVRQVFYQATVQGLVPKNETRGYRVIQRRLVTLRESGVIPYGWITDNARMIRGHHRYQDPHDFAQQVASLYRRDYWARSPQRVEVWLEKDALAGVLYPTVVEEWGLDLYVTRGFASISYLENAAAAARADGRPTIIIVLTDLDPSGVDIARKIAQELPRRARGVDVSVDRLAVTPEQVERLSLPTRPTKRSDTRSARFARQYGTTSVELDAIPPSILRPMVSTAIEQHADPAELARLKRVEQLEQDSLASAWGSR